MLFTSFPVLLYGEHRRAHYFVFLKYKLKAAGHLRQMQLRIASVSLLIRPVREFIRRIRQLRTSVVLPFHARWNNALTK